MCVCVCVYESHSRQYHVARFVAGKERIGHCRNTQGLSWCKESTCKAGATGDVGSIIGLGRSPGGGQGNPRQYSCLENPTDSGAWQATVHGVAESRTHLNHVSTHTCVHNGITTPETNTTPQINCISIKFFSKQVGLAGPRVSDSQPVAKRGAGWGSHRADCLLHVGGRIGR